MPTSRRPAIRSRRASRTDASDPLRAARRGGVAHRLRPSPPRTAARAGSDDGRRCAGARSRRRGLVRRFACAARPSHRRRGGHGDRAGRCRPGLCTSSWRHPRGRHANMSCSRRSGCRCSPTSASPGSSATLSRLRSRRRTSTSRRARLCPGAEQRCVHARRGRATGIDRFAALAGATGTEVVAAARAGGLGDPERFAVLPPPVAAVIRRLVADPHLRCTAAELALVLRHSGAPVAVELRAGAAAGARDGRGPGRSPSSGLALGARHASPARPPGGEQSRPPAR